MSEQGAAQPEGALDLEITRAWNTVVLNDPINLQGYVTFVFRTHFGHTRSTAHRLMMQVHEEGRAVVSTDEREVAEGHVRAMHTYGLRAILEEVR